MASTVEKRYRRKSLTKAPFPRMKPTPKFSRARLVMSRGTKVEQARKKLVNIRRRKEKRPVTIFAKAKDSFVKDAVTTFCKGSAYFRLTDNVTNAEILITDDNKLWRNTLRGEWGGFYIIVVDDRPQKEKKHGGQKEPTQRRPRGMKKGIGFATVSTGSIALFLFFNFIVRNQLGG